MGSRLRPGARRVGSCPSAPTDADVDRAGCRRGRRTSPTDNEVFTPPFIGSRIVKGIGLDEIAEYVNETALYRNQWQFRPEKDAAGGPRATTRSRPASGHVPRAARRGEGGAGCSCRRSSTATSRPTATATTSSCGPTSPARPRRPGSTFPRQKAAPFLCIADFFRAVDSGERDYAAFHIVTMGAAVSEETARLFAADEYQQYLLLHGLGVEMAEALAEYWHRRIRDEWGFAGEDGPTMTGLFRQQYRGGRYSWGYPACPDLEDNATVARLLGAERIGIEVSEETGWQYQPEQTTSAIICHHPQAKYFVAR